MGCRFLDQLLDLETFEPLTLFSDHGHFFESFFKILACSKFFAVVRFRPNGDVEVTYGSPSPAVKGNLCSSTKKWKENAPFFESSTKNSCFEIISTECTYCFQASKAARKGNNVLERAPEFCTFRVGCSVRTMLVLRVCLLRRLQSKYPPMRPGQLSSHWRPQERLSGCKCGQWV